MSDKLATILMASVHDGIGARAQRWLLDEYNCSLGNNLPASQCDPTLVDDYFHAKHIAPFYGYPESKDRWLETWVKWEPFTLHDNLYYYNCGDGDWNGLDEPGTRGDIAMRPFNYGRAYQENEMVHALMPGLKTVVTHPFPQKFTDERIPSDVWAWRLLYLYIEQNPDSWREKWGVPADKEVWCYLINEDLSNPNFNLAEVGKQCRAFGLSACLIYKATHPRLWDAKTKGITADGKRLLKGMVSA